MNEDLEQTVLRGSEVRQLRDALSKAEARAEEYKRIGKQLEDDARKHFDQSCTNLKRAEAAEARVKALFDYVNGEDGELDEVDCPFCERTEQGVTPCGFHVQLGVALDMSRAAESRATQLARVLGFLLEAAENGHSNHEEEPCSLCAALRDARAALAAPQGAPKKED